MRAASASCMFCLCCFQSCLKILFKAELDHLQIISGLSRLDSLSGLLSLKDNLLCANNVRIMNLHAMEDMYH